MGIDQSLSRTRGFARGLRHLLCAALAGAMFAVPPVAAEMHRRTLTVGDIPRDYLLYLPDRHVPEGGLPLVVVLHGGNTVADMILHYSRFNEIAARENFAVAYPYGVFRWWNDGRLPPGLNESNADDVAFMRALVADLGIYGRPIDRGRIFATGISNGGFMSLRLACEAADLFAGVAAVGCPLGGGEGWGRHGPVFTRATYQTSINPRA